MNGYELSRNFVDFGFENPSKIKPNHYAVFFFAIEHCNRLGWKKEFGLPTTMTMEAIGIKSYNTYIKTFKDLVSFGFFIWIEESKNQYSSNIIALSNFNKALNKSLDKAFIMHETKRSECKNQSNIESIDSINKPITNKPITNKPINVYAELYPTFEDFWDEYDKKIGKKEKVQKKWAELKQDQKDEIMAYIPNYKLSQPDKQFRKNPETFLNNESWNDELIFTKTESTQNKVQERIKQNLNGW